MTARIAGKLVVNRIPGLGVDQRLVLAGVELTLVGNLPGVDRVGEQPVEVAAREGFAAALGAVPCCATLCSQAEAIGLILDPAHASELAIKPENTPDSLGLGRVDGEGPLARVIAQGGKTAHPHPLLL